MSVYSSNSNASRHRIWCEWTQCTENALIETSPQSNLRRARRSLGDKITSPFFVT